MNFAPLNILFLDFRNVSRSWVSLQHHRNIRRCRAICIKYEYYNINLRIVAAQHNGAALHRSLYVRRVLKRDINIPKIRTRYRIVFSHLQRINWCLCGRARDRVSSPLPDAVKSAAMSLTFLPTPLYGRVFPSIILPRYSLV